MKSTTRVKSYLAIAGLAVALASGAGATMAATGDYVAPPLGSTYTYASRDTGSYGSATGQVTSTKAERTWEGKPIAATVTPSSVTLVNSAGASLGMLAPDDTPMFTFDPPMVTYDYPLVVGKTWTKSYLVTVHKGKQKQIVPFDTTGKVEAYEDVTVPAGTYKAFKVSFSNTLGEDNVSWFVPELGIPVKIILTRTAESKLGAGTREFDLVAHTIKR